jgi:thioesterase domain-containing protein
LQDRINIVALPMLSAEDRHSERDMLTSPTSRLDEAWVVAFSAEGTQPPLFCPCAGGGSAETYRPLAHALPAQLPVIAFALPPIAERGPFPSVEQLAELFLGKMRRIQPAGPYRLCGHSFGGLVAFEIALRLRAVGEAVSFLGLLDTEHPGMKTHLSASAKLRFRATYFVNRSTKYCHNLLTGRIDAIWGDVLQFMRGRLKALRSKLLYGMSRRGDWTTQHTSDQAELVLAAAWNRYEPPVYRGDLHLFRAADRSIEYASDRTLGWDAAVAGSVRISTHAGDHLSMLQEPNVRALADAMVACLAASIPSTAAQ